MRAPRFALRELASVGTKDGRRRIVAALEQLAENPRPFGSAKLATTVSTYRIRTGDYRVVYEVLDEVRIVDVIKIGHRREVYR